MASTGNDCDSDLKFLGHDELISPTLPICPFVQQHMGLPHARTAKGCTGLDRHWSVFGSRGLRYAYGQRAAGMGVCRRSGWRHLLSDQGMKAHTWPPSQARRYVRSEP